MTYSIVYLAGDDLRSQENFETATEASRTARQRAASGFGPVAIWEHYTNGSRSLMRYAT